MHGLIVILKLVLHRPALRMLVSSVWPEIQLENSQTASIPFDKVMQSNQLQSPMRLLPILQIN
uniref:Uncharacterized protein n=1 Tax=Rhizophora mucronata TaxID=61149 RepID=A0A2P2QBE1_RHIMU